MTYEILARNELNSKLSEINAFLEDRASAQAENDRKKELVMDEIQKDLGERLQKSREELSEIKKHMTGKNEYILKHSHFSRFCTARGSSTGFSRVSRA